MKKIIKALLLSLIASTSMITTVYGWSWESSRTNISQWFTARKASFGFLGLGLMASAYYGGKVVSALSQAHGTIQTIQKILLNPRLYEIVEIIQDIVKNPDVYVIVNNLAKTSENITVLGKFIEKTKKTSPEIHLPSYKDWINDWVMNPYP